MPSRLFPPLLFAGLLFQALPAPAQTPAGDELVIAAQGKTRAVIVVAAITVLQEIGVPIGPLLGSVAVVGLAVAFGAQSLIKDYFTGFLVLL